MEDIQNNKASAPEIVVTILKSLKSKYITIDSIEKAKAEKFMRELASLQLSLYTKQKKAVMDIKSLCKEIL
jgi:hypothetical protein